MLLQEYKIQFAEELQKIYDEKEVESFFTLLLEAFHGMKRIDFALNPQLELDALQLLQWETVLDQLKQEKPIQYILGETDFFGMSFYTNEYTLIPRPETEELVDWVIQTVSTTKKGEKVRILDIGTGTGCIAISLAKNIPMAEVYAIDVSLKALEVAKRNAKRNNVTIEFIHQDLLILESLETTFDIIVSNPPYVRNLEKLEIKKNVLDYEPHLALFVEDTDPLIFYKKIAQLALKSLSKKGCLFFEINQYLGKEMIELMEDFGFENINLHKDIYGNDRMLLGHKS
ncbi:protein-(glutamine-N5) methyltransferase, release factor-specific [Flavobacterium columnare NBRC 100251 = ATCC 23463]|uniref:Release factor glutamine methyltransferase n=1 Tax=Flavobacterium columnare TaxID=996 RepID=A0AAI8G9L9_9FLAO|nr:peptide chain release factor N(5)-glutamine methyltransferase [Flavobacterium columnare]AMO18962.1 peptide chain release factor N(5)-glutamine methyltransferase [Flavobacterium columnare]ANO47871.1 N5-glutamine S-adenosyl-L-methionine-dependent methyltransferase [Flavobacterium columnare]APT21540.1 protein-(glutamine-N5) methyltransferase, release factor-specific [Flavobacterium columnare]AUX16879.1 protein-(glutamine-N5) methyltransferase, release factor-specific [Flavobacterium columnare]